MCGWVLAGLVPHSSSSRLLTKSSGSAPMLAPTVRRMASVPEAEQSARSRPEAPIRVQRRWLQTSACTPPSVPE